MTTIEVRKRLDSNTVTVQSPELDSMIGKEVKMTLVVEEVSDYDSDLQEFLDIMKERPADMDLDAMERIVNEMREISKI